MVKNGLIASNPMNILKKVKETIESNNLFKRGETIIVGVSGGPDSMALLHILFKLRQDYGIRLHIVYVNHGLRKSAVIDQKFVKDIAQKLSLPFTTTTLTVKPQKGKSSLEEQGREKRFNFLFMVARKQKAKTIALGHTQDDLAETVLMRIIRGTGLHGLPSILPKRPFKNFFLIRPLLEVNRNEILSYLKSRKISFRIDPTNRQTKFFRNKIRWHLLPLIEKKYNPRAKEILANLAYNAAFDYDLISLLGRYYIKKILYQKNSNMLQLKIPKLNSLHPSLQRMLVRLSLEELTGHPHLINSEQVRKIEQLIQKGPNKAIVDLIESISVQKSSPFLKIFKRKIKLN